MTGVITELPTRGFSVLCSDDLASTVLREVTVFCVDTQISDGLARQGLLVPGSQESSGKGSVIAFRNVMQKTCIGDSMDKTVIGVEITISFK